MELNLLFAVTSVGVALTVRGRMGPLSAAIAGIALWESLVLAAGLLLGHAGLLRPAAYRSVVSTLIAMLLVAALAHRRLPAVGPPRVRLRLVRSLKTRRGSLLAASLLFLLVTATFQLAQDGLYGTLQSDGLHYHLPRAEQWRWHGSFEPWAAPTFGQVGLAVGGDIVLAHNVLLGNGFRGVCLSTVLLTLGSALCVLEAARLLGLRRSAGLTAAAAFLAFPAVGLRLAELSSDAAAGFPVLAGWVLSAVIAPGVGLALFAALSGMAIACKATTTPFVLLLGALRLHEVVRKRGWRPSREDLFRLAAGAIVASLAVIASYAPVVQAFGDPFGGETGRNLNVLREGPSAVGKSVAAALLHWGAEPLGYAPPSIRRRLGDALGLPAAYRSLGGRGGDKNWRPYWLSIDSATTGLLPLAALPILLFGLRRGARWKATLLLSVGFLLLFAPLAPYPFLGRYAFVLFAGIALLWGAAFGARPRALRGLALAALLFGSLSGLAISGFSLVKARGVHALGAPYQPGEAFPDAKARAGIARRLRGGPILILTRAESHDAFLAGADVDLRYDYVGCPANGDWTALFRNLASPSRVLFLRIADEDARGLGVPYSGRLRSPCLVTPANARRALDAAGWNSFAEEPGFALFEAPIRPLDRRWGK